jgi:hypothetical protein
MLSADHPLLDRQQHRQPIPCADGVPRLSGPPGEAVPGSEGVGVLGARHPLKHRQQQGQLIPCPDGVPRVTRPIGEVLPGGQGLGMLRAGGGSARSG